MSDERITVSAVRYEQSWVRNAAPDPYPEIVLGDEQRADEAIMHAIRLHFDRALFEAFVPGVKDVTPNTLEAPHER